MGSITENWKRKFEELSLIKENLERMIYNLLEIKSTAQVDRSQNEVKKKVEENKRNQRQDPENANNTRLQRTPDQRERRGSERRV
jgi:hypothetical protein